MVGWILQHHYHYWYYYIVISLSTANCSNRNISQLVYKCKLYRIIQWHQTDIAPWSPLIWILPTVHYGTLDVPQRGRWWWPGLWVAPEVTIRICILIITTQNMNGITVVLGWSWGWGCKLNYWLMFVVFKWTVCSVWAAPCSRSCWILGKYSCSRESQPTTEHSPVLELLAMWSNGY